MAGHSITNYQFCVKAGNTWLVGEQPIAIVQSWKTLQSWFGKAWLIGFLSYEQGYSFMQAPRSSVLHTAKPDAVRLPNVYFGVFKKIQRVKKLPSQYTSLNLKWKSQFTKQDYINTYKKIIKHIRQGDIYQANLSYRLSAKYKGKIDDVFAALYRAQPTDYAAFISTPTFGIASASPELLLSVNETRLESHPMKGTAITKRNLQNSSKDKAELDMIIDIHRNDLARIALPGSVKLIQRRRLTKLPTVWQANAVIQSTRSKGTTALDALQVLHPAGSITGAPKLRAMEILHTLEPTRRNVYCGTIGYIDPRGNAQFNVGIRTAYIKDDMLYYHTGGGIVFDSEMENEYNETVWKSQLTALL